MAFQLSTFKLPCGVLCGRVEWSGVQTAEEAGAVLQALSPGGQLDGLSLLVLTQKLESMTPEARRTFSSSADRTWVAIVVTNPLIRVGTNFVLRMTKHSKRQMFSTEEEAIRWLDAHVREDAGRKT